ncbi:MAG: efflux RND transporter periplasmic adaptor subunit [Alphaproteobacteria bacterium]|nr:efflux RND transporter periplasmic adaptor subunit [Alphaproteobacteria bacterium]
MSAPRAAGDAGRPKSLSRRRTWIAAAAIVVIVILAIIGFTVFSPKKSTLVTADVTVGNIEQSVLATGTLEPARLVSVGAQVSGQVKKLYVDLGDVVKQGDPIADIDSTTQQNTVSNAEAGLNNQQAQRAATAANLALAEQTLARDKLLYDQGAVSQAEYQSADAQAQQLRNQLKAQDAQIKQSSLTLSTAKVNLGYTKITAPMDGTIVAVITEEGQTVNANQSAPTIVKLAQLDKMTVNAQISEADVDKVKAGQTVYFTTLGDTRTRHYAKLRAIEPAPPSIETESSSSSSSSSSDAAVYYNGLFDVDNKDGSLRTGMTAQVYIVQASAKRTLLIPSSALGARSRDGTYAVKVQGAGGKIETRQVKIGIDTNVSAQVLDGLKEGEKVVVAEGGKAQPSSSSSRRRGPGGLGGLGGGGGGRRGRGG